MNWLDKLKGKMGRPDGSPAQGEQTPRQPPDREGGRTVVRAGMKPGSTLAMPGIRFQPNDEVTTDLRIKGLLGSGGMGEVYLARQRLWDVDVAVKVPNYAIVSDPDNRHRIVREAEAWTDLGLHPHIAYCYYAQPLGGLLLLVIEYVDGGNLRDWIADGRCADVRTGLDLAIQFCHGLEHAHKRGLLHRDIKPENILLMNDGTLKITDFGIVRKALSSPEKSESINRRAAPSMTVAGIGTAAYMAPEQWGDQSEIDLRADIFAFGVCLYEMLCGARPYPMTAGPRQETPEPGRMRGGKGLPERLCRLMKRCVDWDRRRRPAAAREVLAELSAMYSEEFGEPCPHAELPELTTLADDWNNRALSYVALGRAEDAEVAWQIALDADPQNVESNYNYALHRWRGAKATDSEVLTNLRGLAQSEPSAWLPRYLLAQVHLERGDAEGAREELAKIQGDDQDRAEVTAARRAVSELPSISSFVQTFKGASGPVYSVCLSADGRFALSGGDDKKLKLWQVESGQCLRTFEGHTERVVSVCLNVDGRLALSGSWDATLRLWNVEGGSCLRTFRGHTRQVDSVCLTADGRFGLSGSKDGTLKLWEIESGRCLRTLKGHGANVTSVFRSADERLVLSGSADKKLKLWDAETGTCLHDFQGHTDEVTSVCLSADGKLALSGSEDKTLKLWDVQSGKCLRTFQGHTDRVHSVCLSADGQFALSGSLGDGTLRLWEVKSTRCLHTWVGQKVGSFCLGAVGTHEQSANWDDTPGLQEIGAFRHRASLRLGRLTASAESFASAARYAAALSAARKASEAGDVTQVCRCLRRARQNPIYRRAARAAQEWSELYTKLQRRGLADCWLVWSAPNAIAGSICLSADGRYALSVRGSSIQLWDSGSGLCLRAFEGHTAQVNSVCLSADGRYAMSGSDDKTSKLWDAQSGGCLRTFESGSRVASVCLSGNGRFALVGSKDNMLKLWDVESGGCLKTLVSGSRVASACLSGNGRFALAGSKDKTLKLWEVESGRCLRTFEGHTELITSVSLSADGRYGLSASRDKILKLWVLESGLCLRTFEGHADHLLSACLSADGRYALSGSWDRTVRLWELKSGNCLRTLEHESGVTFVGLSADGRLAVSACKTGTLTAWFLDWDLEENEPADWDEGARPYLEVFLRSHRPYGVAVLKGGQQTDEEIRMALHRQDRPMWSEDDFKGLLYTLGCAGYGWLRPEGVRRELERMTAEWKEPQ